MSEDSMSFARLLVSVAALCITGAASAQTYPTKPIKIIVGYAPGGTVDFLARLVTPTMAEQLKQTVLVENRPGASGTIGASFVAKSAPDGYTILACATTELALLPHVISVPFDAMRDFTPLVLAATSPTVTVVHASVPANNAKELIELAKAKGGLPYGTPGPGSSSHIAFELLRAVSNIDFVHVPYKGGGPATADLVGGQIPLAVLSSVSLAAHMRAGRAKALAVLQTERSSLMPNIPTFKEATGYDINAATSYGFMLPAKTPAAIVAELESAILKNLTDPAVRKRLTEMMLEPLAMPSQPFATWLGKENAYNESAIKRIGKKLKLD
jgi:tripartite-type tricarboxylate transporter receptor subunit TctC